MAEISYFQKYSQRENHITNNTMLMFRHIYRHNPLRFEKFLKEIISDAQIDIGLVFSQQIREQSSIPDGYIRQTPLSIYIEAKADGELYLEQIQRHVDSVVKSNLPKGSAVIIGLAKKQPNEADIREFERVCNEVGIHYTTITYLELVALLNDKGIFPEHETDLQEIIEDYETFLRSDGMLPNPYEMVAFPCGTSWDENIKYSIYYEQSSKSSKAHVPFIGIYNNKKITHIAEILGTCICKPENGGLIFEKEYGCVSQEDIDKIRDVISATNYYDLNQGLERYYLLGDLYEVNIEKKSSGGIRGHRYFDLKELSGDKILPEDSIEDISRKVSGSSFI